ncbi:MAG: hypothetical protein IKU54_03930 [Oscillospiraceae bacterium]|nr:hypothetical protein [Oscillospiraceae bacterium]
MTAYEILEIAFALAGEKIDEFPDKRIALMWLNVIIVEAMPAENTLREKSGLGRVVLPKMMTDLTQVVNMDEQLCRLCLPLGIAAFLCEDRENYYMAETFRQRFTDAMQTTAGARERSVTDCYGGEL